MFVPAGRRCLMTIAIVTLNGNAISLIVYRCRSLRNGLVSRTKLPYMLEKKGNNQRKCTSHPVICIPVKSRQANMGHGID